MSFKSEKLSNNKYRIFQTFRDGEIFKIKFSYYTTSDDIYAIGNLTIDKFIKDDRTKPLYYYQKEATKEHYANYFVKEED